MPLSCTTYLANSFGDDDYFQHPFVMYFPLMSIYSQLICLKFPPREYIDDMYKLHLLNHSLKRMHSSSCVSILFSIARKITFLVLLHPCIPCNFPYGWKYIYQRYSTLLWFSLYFTFGHVFPHRELIIGGIYSNHFHLLFKSSNHLTLSRLSHFISVV